MSKQAKKSSAHLQRHPVNAGTTTAQSEAGTPANQTLCRIPNEQSRFKCIAVDAERWYSYRAYREQLSHASVVHRAHPEASHLFKSVRFSTLLRNKGIDAPAKATRLVNTEAQQKR